MFGKCFSRNPCTGIAQKVSRPVHDAGRINSKEKYGCIVDEVTAHSVTSFFQLETIFALYTVSCVAPLCTVHITISVPAQQACPKRAELFLVDLLSLDFKAPVVRDRV